MNFQMIALIIALVVAALAAVILLVCALIAPVGHEDADGFHAHKPKTRALRRSAVSKPEKKSSTLIV